MTKRIAVLVGTLLACAGVSAQTYPNKPLRMVIPFPPGGSNDIVGRMVATQLGERLGHSVVVDNRGGAGGIIGTEAVAKAPPDGYTLLLISVAYAFNTSLYKKIPYDPVKSFMPVSMLATGPVALAVYSQLPVNSTADLIALAKQKTGALQFASAGVGSFQHLAGRAHPVQGRWSRCARRHRGARELPTRLVDSNAAAYARGQAEGARDKWCEAQSDSAGDTDHRGDGAGIRRR
jgi:tripartite-type tricarboxylate transporter receptor subunit TctC